MSILDVSKLLSQSDMFAPNGKSRTVFNNMNHEQTDTLFGPWKQSASGVQNILLAHNSIQSFAREEK